MKNRILLTFLVGLFAFSFSSTLEAQPRYRNHPRRHIHRAPMPPLPRFCPPPSPGRMIARHHRMIQRSRRNHDRCMARRHDRICDRRHSNRWHR